MARLIRGDTGEEFELSDGVTRIGRLSANEVQVFEPQVSRSHCHIEGPEGGWVVIDHGSDLGTFVNGHRVRLRGLYSGDELRIGGAVLVFHDEPGTQITKGGVKLRPLTEASVDELIPPEIFVPPPRPVPKRTVYGLIGLGVAAVLVVVALVAMAVRETPRKVVLRAGRLLGQRDADALWELVAADQRKAMSIEAFRRRVAGLPHAVVLAARQADVREHRRIRGGVAVPVAIDVDGRRVADEVLLRREDGRWRIHGVPVARLSELLPPAAGAASEPSP